VAQKGAWIKLRKQMSKYPETPQQKNVKIGGSLIKTLCTGLKGSDFFQCRSDVLKCAFDDKECEQAMLELKQKMLEEMV